MDIFKEASKVQLRVQTNKGNLSVEQLWDLKVAELDELAVQLEEEHKNSGKKSFVVKKTDKDKTTELRFKVVLDILQTKVEADQAAQQKLEDKEWNEKILQRIANKEEEKLDDLSITQLKKQLR